MPGRPWTSDECDFIRAHYRNDMTAKQIAAAIDRSERAVYMQVYLMGLHATRDVLSDEQVLGFLKRLHPLGYSDSEILKLMSKETGYSVDNHRIGKLRRSLGFASNKHSDRQRQKTRENTAKQLADAGLSSIGCLRAEAFKRWVRELGWPDTLTVRAAQAAELFYRRGPMTRLQLCEAMGMKERGLRDRCEPASRAKGGTVMAELMNAGLLMCLKRAVANGVSVNGRPSRVHLYLLNPGVRPSVRTQERSDQVV
jgi:hypothetical protein